VLIQQLQPARRVAVFTQYGFGLCVGVFHFRGRVQCLCCGDVCHTWHRVVHRNRSGLLLERLAIACVHEVWGCPVSFVRSVVCMQFVLISCQYMMLHAAAFVRQVVMRHAEAPAAVSTGLAPASSEM
jgi:ethanolamine ammonia-lyase large subunit